MQENSELSLDAMLLKHISKLDCIPAVTYPHLLQHFRRQISGAPDDSFEGLAVVLTCVGEIHSRITNVTYRRLCAELHSEKSAARVSERLQLDLKDFSPPWPWLETANHLVSGESYAAETLYCVLNSFFWTPPDPRRHIEELLQSAILIAEACCDLGSSRVAIEVLERVLQKPNGEYGDEALTEWLAAAVVRLQSESAITIEYVYGCVASLIRALCESIRFNDAMSLFFAWLKYWESSSPHPRLIDLDRLLESDFSKLNSVMHWHFVEVVANLMELTGDEDAAKTVHYLLKPLKKPSGHFIEPTRLRQAFAVARIQCSTGAPDSALGFLDSLLGIRRTNDAARDAELRVARLREMEEVLGVDDALLFAAEISSCMRQIPESTDGEVSRLASFVAFELLFPSQNIESCRPFLVSGGKPAVIGRQLSPAKKASQIRAMTAVVRARRTMVIKNTSSAAVAAPLFQAVCQDFSWLDSDGGAGDVTTKLKAIELWIDLVCPTLESFPFDTFEKFIKWHRTTQLTVQDASPLDRENFVLGTGRLRSMILDAANAASIRTTNEGEAKRIRECAIVWTAELQQRLAVERMLIQTESFSRFKAGPSPTTEWPFKKPYPTDGGPGAVGIISAMASSHEESPQIEVATEQDDEPTEGQSMSQQEVDSLARQGLRPLHLANAIQRDEVLLQLDFTRDGRPLLTAVRSNNGKIEVIHSNKGSGQPAASSRVAVSAAIHETLVRLLVSSPDEQAMWRGALNNRRTRLSYVCDQLRQSDTAGQQKAATALAKSIKSLSGERPILSDVFYKVLSPNDSRSHERWEQFVSHGAVRIAEFLTDTFAPGGWLEWVGLIKIDSSNQSDHERRVREALNDATQRFLTEVAAEINFDELAIGHLEPTTTRLVIQANDEWQNVPIAFLPAANGRLFEHVRCTRNVFSLLLNRISCSIEAEASPPTDEGNLFCLSWFDETKRNEFCACWAMELHRRKASIAKRFNLTSYEAAQIPPGNVSTLAAGFSERSYRVATICGHGEMRGVNLGPDPINKTSYWNGGGIDLSQVELVIMVSCSLGRIKRTSDLDSDGFFITQAINRGRSSIACRWPVLLDEAVPFATDITERFLKYRESHRVEEGWLRATALNDARKSLYGHRTSGDVSNLSTATAFDLFGLG